MSKMLSVIASLSIIYNSHLLAAEVDCKLDTLLSEKQLHTLSQADQIKRVFLNKAMLGPDVYKVKVLNNKKTNQLLVFLGETHIKGPRSSYIGKKMANEYSVRIIEGVPKAEMEAMAKNDPEIYSAMTWKRKVFQYLTFNPFGSTIHTAMKTGENFGLKELSQAVIDRDANGEYTEKDAQNLKELVAQTKNPIINLPMEFGDYLEPSRENDYILTARNERMAKNISLISEVTAVKGPQLVIIGYGHLPGLINLLESKEFEVCKLDLSL
jgi:hypothetical protein